MKMTQEYRNYRRLSGMVKFEKDCRLTSFNGRRMKAYKVPGTPENGQWEMYKVTADRTAKREGWTFYA